MRPESAAGLSRRLLPLVFALVAATGLLTAPAGAAEVRAAAPDLTIVTDATYEVQPEKHRVQVTVDMVLTNHLHDTATRRYYFDHAFIAVLPAASDYKLTWSGSGKPAVAVSKKTDKYTRPGPDARGAHLQRRDRQVPTALLPRRSGRRGHPGRPGRGRSRILPGLGLRDQFDRGQHRPGGLPRRVRDRGRRPAASRTRRRTPPDASCSRPRRWPSRSTSSPTWSAIGPGAFAVQSVTTQVGSQPVEVNIEAWPDDKPWSDRVAGLVRRGLPALAARIGQPWPRKAGLVIEESVARSTGGYAGLYDPDAGSVEIAYFADDPVVLHESAHAWFNGSLLADRWANEAFASYYGFATAADLGIEGKPDALTPALEAARIPLNAWGAVGREDSKTEDYAYAASLVLARAIAERAGDDGLKQVWADATAHVGAYQPPAGTGDAAPTAPETVDGPPDWRGLLDLLDSHTGKSFEDLWRTWVTRPSDEPLLDARRAARAQYDQVVAKAGDWRLPRPVRDAMRAWQFDDATALLRDASGVLEERSAVEAAAAKSGLTAPTTLRTAFETPGGFGAASQEATAERAAIDRYDAAVESRIAAPDAFQTLGLWDATPESSLAESRDAFAAGDLARSVRAAGAAAAAWSSAAEIGRARAISIGAGTLAILLALIMVVAVVRGLRRRRAAGRLVAAGAAGGAGSMGLDLGQPAGQAWTDADAAAAGFAWAALDGGQGAPPAALDGEFGGVASPAPDGWVPVAGGVSVEEADALAGRDEDLGDLVAPANDETAPGPGDSGAPLAPDAATERVSGPDAYATLAATSAPPEAQAGDEAQTGAGPD